MTMSWLWLFYLIPLLVVSVATLIMALYNKGATRGAVLAGLAISLIPALNIVAMFTLIEELFKSDSVKSWLNEPVRKSEGKR